MGTMKSAVAALAKVYGYHVRAAVWQSVVCGVAHVFCRLRKRASPIPLAFQFFHFDKLSWHQKRARVLFVLVS